MVGLVSKARKERQMASMKANSKEREQTATIWTGIKSKMCKCGFETSGMMRDGRLICPKCKEVL